MAGKAPTFLDRNRGLVADTDSLVRRLAAEVKAHAPCTSKLFPTQGAILQRSREDFATRMREIWTELRALLASSSTVSDQEGRRSIADVTGSILRLMATLEAERNECVRDYVKPPKPKGIFTAGDQDEIGADDDQPLEIQTGLWHGNAIAYCPQTGHMAIEPLRAQAAKLARAGRLPDGISGDLVDALESLHIGDDLILEHADDVIGDDVIEVGRGKVAKKIAKVSKKAVQKVAKAGKAVAKSKLGKVIKTAVTMTNPVAAVSMKALSKGASVVKKAKAKPKPKTAKAAASPKAKQQAKQSAKAKTTVKLAQATQKGKTSPKKANAIAKKKGIPKSDVKQTAQALSVVDAAEAGNPTAQAVVATHNQVETAREVPLDTASFATEEADYSSPGDYEAAETEEMPESEPEESYFGDEPEAEEMPDEAEQLDEEEASEDEESEDE